MSVGCVSMRGGTWEVVQVSPQVDWLGSTESLSSSPTLSWSLLYLFRWTTSTSTSTSTSTTTTTTWTNPPVQWAGAGVLPDLPVLQ